MNNNLHDTLTLVFKSKRFDVKKFARQFVKLGRSSNDFEKGGSYPIYWKGMLLPSRFRKTTDSEYALIEIDLPMEFLNNPFDRDHPDFKTISARSNKYTGFLLDLLKKIALNFEIVYGYGPGLPFGYRDLNPYALSLGQRFSQIYQINLFGETIVSKYGKKYIQNSKAYTILWARKTAILLREPFSRSNSKYTNEFERLANYFSLDPYKIKLGEIPAKRLEIHFDVPGDQDFRSNNFIYGSFTFTGVRPDGNNSISYTDWMEGDWVAILKAIPTFKKGKKHVFTMAEQNGITLELIPDPERGILDIAANMEPAYGKGLRGRIRIGLYEGAKGLIEGAKKLLPYVMLLSDENPVKAEFELVLRESEAELKALKRFSSAST